MVFKPVIAGLEIGDDTQRWRDVGFSVDQDGTCQVGTVRINLVSDNGTADNGSSSGIRAWSLITPARPAGTYSISGLLTKVITPEADSPAPLPIENPAHANGMSHPNGALSIDHLVIFSPNLDDTIAELSPFGLEPRRTRQHEAFGQPMRQVFFRMGEVVLELVGPDKEGGEGQAGFFGLTFTVEDLDLTASFLKEHIGRVKDAVQPGRRIATLRKTAGLQTAIAFMTPDIRS